MKLYFLMAVNDLCFEINKKKSKLSLLIPKAWRLFRESPSKISIFFRQSSI